MMSWARLPLMTQQLTPLLLQRPPPLNRLFAVIMLQIKQTHVALVLQRTPEVSVEAPKVNLFLFNSNLHPSYVSFFFFFSALNYIGSCSASCTSCGGTFCGGEDEVAAPTEPTEPTEPGICCHYATDAADICGTCKAPDDGNCGASPAACAKCGGGSNTGWCPMPKDDSDAKSDTADSTKKAEDSAEKDAAEVEDKVESKTDEEEMKKAEDIAEKDAAEVEDKVELKTDEEEMKKAEDSAEKDAAEVEGIEEEKEETQTKHITDTDEDTTTPK
jgi:hypothetical protein